MTLATNRQSDELNELKRDICDDIDDVVATTPLSCNEKYPVISCPDKTEKNRQTEKRFSVKRDLLNVGILGDVSLFLNSRTQDKIQEPQTLVEAKKTPQRVYWIDATLIDKGCLGAPIRTGYSSPYCPISDLRKKKVIPSHY